MGIQKEKQREKSVGAMAGVEPRINSAGAKPE